MKYQASWRSPSNIALVKYWGKHGQQWPQNPSLSFTLSSCHTTMTMKASMGNDAPSVNVLYEGQPKPTFVPKILSFFSKLNHIFPWLKQTSIEIDSRNTFPHGAGIASSASAMSAIALCLMDIDHKISGTSVDLNASWWKTASEIARLGSGSACRSVFPVVSVWGKTESIPDSNDDFAIPWADQIANHYRNYQDTILIVSASEKSVSSTAGHAMMENLSYAPARYAEAEKHIKELISCMATPFAQEQFISICESEALQLHALMMCGASPYILMEANTVSIMKEIWRYRKETSVPVCFTLDAGPNVHVLYPKEYTGKVLPWIQSTLLKYCAGGQYILDEAGQGPQKMD